MVRSSLKGRLPSSWSRISIHSFREKYLQIPIPRFEEVGQDNKIQGLCHNNPYALHHWIHHLSDYSCR